MAIDPARAEESNWKDVLPEKPETVQGVGTGGGKLFATYLKDVRSTKDQSFRDDSAIRFISV